MSKVLAVVIAYEHYDALDRCLESVLRQTHSELDLVIWDNTQPSTYPGLSVADGNPDRNGWNMTVASPSNLLWTPALNTAIVYGDHEAGKQDYEHDYILTLNHDVVLPSSCVANLVQAFEELPDHAGAVGPTGHGLGGQQGASAHRIGPRERVNFLIGACTMYKKNVYDEVGPFDEKMPLSGDDFDYAQRLKEAGYSLWVDETTPIDHISHITSDSENWGTLAKASWAAFENKYSNYFANEQEAIRGLWTGQYDPDYPIGTGISREEKIKRGIINEHTDTNNLQG